MARSSVVFISIPVTSQESAEAINFLLASLFGDIKFTLVSALERSCVGNAAAILAKFQPQAVISSKWCAHVRSAEGLLSEREIEGMDNWTKEVDAAIWKNEGPAKFRLRVMLGMKSLKNEATVVCLPREVLGVCTELLAMPLNESTVLAIVDNPCSVKRRLIAECCTFEQIRSVPVSEKFGAVSSIVVARVTEQEDVVRRLFMSALPASGEHGEISGLSVFAEETRSNIEALSSKVTQSMEYAQSVLTELGNRTCEEERELNEVAMKVREVAEKQVALEKNAGDALAISLRDIADISKSLRTLELQMSADKQALTGMHVERPLKRKPLQVISVAQYPASIVATIRSYRHYASMAQMNMTIYEQVISKVKEIPYGEKEVILCKRKKLIPGNYTITFYNHPKHDKVISEPYSFDMTAWQSGYYHESYPYVCSKDIQALEAEIQAKDVNAVEALRTVACLWVNTTFENLNVFLQVVRDYQGEFSAHNLRTALVERGLKMLELS